MHNNNVNRAAAPSMHYHRLRHRRHSLPLFISPDTQTQWLEIRTAPHVCDATPRGVSNTHLRAPCSSPPTPPPRVGTAMGYEPPTTPLSAMKQPFMPQQPWYQGQFQPPRAGRVGETKTTSVVQRKQLTRLHRDTPLLHQAQLATLAAPTMGRPR